MHFPTSVLFLLPVIHGAKLVDINAINMAPAHQALIVDTAVKALNPENATIQLLVGSTFHKQAVFHFPP